MTGDHILGISIYWFLMIVIFWCVVAMVIFGAEILDSGPVQAIIAFFTLGIVLLVGHFGWQILIIPSIAILAAIAWLLWRRINLL